MQAIQHIFPWTEQTDWFWPDDDVKLLQVIDDVNDVADIVEKHVPKRYPLQQYWGTCVQAGAACGIWPRRLSSLFQKVYTVEPLAENIECARENLATVGNVELFQGVLGSGKEPGGRVGMEQHPNEQRNAGSQQVAPLPNNGDAFLANQLYGVTTIDGIVGDDATVDFICLDLEGYELFALQGAQQTIDRCSPVIMVEDKGLSRKFGVQQGAVLQWLSDRGYRVLETIKRDVVLGR